MQQHIKKEFENLVLHILGVIKDVIVVSNK